jgi:hypothetical protein
MWAQGHVGKMYMDPKDTKQYRRADKTRFVSQYNKDMRPLEKRETCIPKKKEKRLIASRWITNRDEREKTMTERMVLGSGRSLISENTERSSASQRSARARNVLTMGGVPTRSQFATSLHGSDNYQIGSTRPSIYN